MVLANGTIVQPDIMIVLRANTSIITEAEIEGAPDFVAETLSPTNRAYDRLVKRSPYALHGVREYWLVDADRQQIAIYSNLIDGQYRRELVVSDTAVSATIPGLSVNVATLVAPRRPTETELLWYVNRLFTGELHA